MKEAKYKEKMQKDMGIAEDQKLPQGYPAVESVSELDNKKKKKPKLLETKQKGERGFIEGCFFALCCCWICDMCF